MASPEVAHGGYGSFFCGAWVWILVIGWTRLETCRYTIYTLESLALYSVV